MSRGQGVWEAEMSFDDKLAAVREAIADVARTFEHDDEPGMIVAAIRLRRALEIAERSAIAIGVGQAEHHASTSAALRVVQDAAHPLLVRVPMQLRGLVAVRRFLTRFNVASLERYRPTPTAAIDASGQTIAGVLLDRTDLSRTRLVGATLRDVHAVGAMLDYLDASGATWLRVQAEAASMRYASFDGCLTDRSDFTRANLECSTWRAASVFWCRFSGCALADVRCDDALFVDCDFRGADLGTVNLGAKATSAGARFVRCDLRETSWNARELRGVSFVDCKLHGIRGEAVVEDIHILRPDVSVAGDASVIASATDVLDRLRGTRR